MHAPHEIPIGQMKFDMVQHKTALIDRFQIG